MNNISIICAVMNRPDRLLPAISNWIAAEGVVEIVIVDWSSAIHISEIIKDYLLRENRLKVVRVIDEKSWILSHAFNLAASYATGDWIVKMDIDYHVEPGFFSSIDLPDEAFMRGSWAVTLRPEDKYLCGFLLVKRSAFLRVNGFNENIVTYGYEDLDIYERLSSCGLTAQVLFPSMIEHIPHDENLRTIHQNQIDRKISTKNNMRVARENPNWIFARWNRTENGELVRIAGD